MGHRLEDVTSGLAQAVPEVLLGILAKCREVEDVNGESNVVVDGVDIVCDVLSGYGLDLRHPAIRTGGTGDVNDYEHPARDRAEVRTGRQGRRRSVVEHVISLQMDGNKGCRSRRRRRAS
jgi:hypothetical protein